MSHPARFSTEVVDCFRVLLASNGGGHVHDPFAGTGERLGQLCDEVGYSFSGTELEPCFIVDPRVRVGDATQWGSYPPTGPLTLVTSPVYPNGMADHWAARDDSRHHTYRAAVWRLEGRDRPLHERNMGRFGYRGRGPLSGQRWRYWNVAEQSVRHWKHASRVLLNVSDFIADRKREPVVADWHALMTKQGWVEQGRYEVVTPRQRHGANGELRVDAEVIIDYGRRVRTIARRAS
jgi:hypothetical protein